MEPLALIDIILKQESAKMTEKQVRIIKAAIELFDQKGYAATSTREIAQKAGVAEGTIFKHYGTKKELMLSISGLIIRNALIPILKDGLIHVLTQPYNSLADFINSFMEDRLQVSREAVPIVRFLLQEIPFQPEIRTLLMENIALMPLEECIGQLKEKGLIQDIPIPKIRNIMLICLSGFFIDRYMLLPELFEEDPTKDFKYLTEFMIRGLSTNTQEQAQEVQSL